VTIPLLALMAFVIITVAMALTKWAFLDAETADLLAEA
jgi:sensor domain CHASE-containing protein